MKYFLFLLLLIPSDMGTRFKPLKINPKTTLEIAYAVADSLIILGARAPRKDIAIGLIQTGWCETGLNPKSISKKGAIGIFQWNNSFGKNCPKTIEDQLWLHIKWLQQAGCIQKIKNSEDIHGLNFAPSKWPNDTLLRRDIPGMGITNGVTTKEEFLNWHNTRLKSFKFKN